MKTIHLSCCTVSSALVDVLLQAPLKSRLKECCPMKRLCRRRRSCGVLPASKCYPNLRLPEYWSVEEDFYRSLARARPTITALNLGFRCLADDACLQMIAELLSLERLEITLMENLTPAAIDIILDSPSGQTLRYFNDYETPIITAATLLRLVRGCPLLNELEWSWNATIAHRGRRDY